MANDMMSRLISFRRDLHQHPEIGYQEFRTTQKISEILTDLGIAHECAPAGMKTGVVATISKGEGPLAVLRADIDALPMTEQTNLPFASVTGNTMHACGHDVHATMLVGAGMLLRDADFNGTVKLVFQPSEEGVNGDPEHKSGGQRMVEGGVIDGAAACVALHVHPLQPVGQLSYAPGEALACASFFQIHIAGKGGHAGAAPHLAIDPILVASHIIQAAQSIVSRNISPTQPAVFSVTRIHGGTSENVIPDDLTMGGTIRAMNTATYDYIVERLRQILHGAEVAYGVRTTLTFTTRYPSVLNDAGLNEKLAGPVDAVFGSSNLLVTEPMLAAEDFAFFSRRSPSMFYFIGARDTADECFFVHHPRVVMNEACIEPGARFLSAAARQILADYAG